MGSPILVEVAAPVSAASWSGFYNNAFTVWPQGESVKVPAGRDLYVCGGWRVVNNHGAGDVLAEKAGVQGGIRLTTSFTAAGQWVYLRQLVPGLMRFSGGVFAPTFEVETCGPVGLDFYGRARYSASDGERLLMADTPTLGPASGRRLVSATFQAPPLSDTEPWPMTDRASAELALRLNSTGPGAATVTVHGAALPDGDQPRYPALESPEAALAAVQAYDESGGSMHTGFDPGRGQKRLWTPFKVTKAMPLTDDRITLWDLQGTRGRVTTYNADGTTQAHGVVPTAIGGSPLTGYQDGFSVILNGSYAAGMAFNWTVRNY